MLKNFNRYGQCLYYREIVNESSEDMNLGNLASDYKVKIGIVYGYTLEMQTITFGVYCIYALNQYFDQRYVLYLMQGLLDAVNRRASR